MEHPLRALSLDDLWARTSLKWRHYPRDVLPAWVAEMDVPLAPPIGDAVTAAVRSGDTGYAQGVGLAEAIAAFADERWNWTFDTARTRIVPDVMLGAVETVRLVTAPGEGIVVNPPHDPAPRPEPSLPPLKLVTNDTTSGRALSLSTSSGLPSGWQIPSVATSRPGQSL